MLAAASGGACGHCGATLPIGTWVFMASMALAPPALAHGGEEHGDAPAPAMTAVAAPRAVAESDEFELVAIAEDKRLILYLDHFATNVPVADARVEVESGTMKAVATEIAPGVYALPAAAFARPGRYPLAISIEAGDSADLLATTLDFAGPATAIARHARSWREWKGWGVPGALLIAAAGWVAVRHRRKNHSRRGNVE